MKNKIENLTLEYGGSWIYNHVQRLLNTIKIIGEGIDYNEEAIWYAAHLHDIGAFAPYNPEKIELGHEIRSRQAAEIILADSNLDSKTKDIIFEAIENHDYRSENKSKYIEAVLLREADFLDFIGTIGIAREFARGPKDVKECCNMIFARRDGVIDKFTLPKAKELTKIRLAKMDEFFKTLQQESFGFL